MFTIIVNLIPQAMIEDLESKEMFNLGTDILSVMDINGTLSYYVGKSTNFVNEDMGNYVSLLPQTYCGNMTIRIYSSSGDPVSFNLQENYKNYTENCNRGNDFTKVKRMFIEYQQEMFGLAEFEVWLR
jgi:hypothetical protein